MSSKKSLTRLRRFFLFAALAIISITTFSPKGAGQMQNPDDRRPVSIDSAPAAESEKLREFGIGHLWRRYIWQSLPTEN